MKKIVILGALLFCFFANGFAQTNHIYALNSNGMPIITKFSIDFTTGAMVLDNTYTSPTDYDQYISIERNPVTNKIYVVKSPSGGNRTLYEFDLNSGIVNEIGKIRATNNSTSVVSIVFNNTGDLFALFNSSGGGNPILLQKIDYSSPDPGNFLPVINVPLSISIGSIENNGGLGLSYNFENNKIIYSTSTNPDSKLYEIDPSTGVTTLYAEIPNEQHAQAIQYIGSDKFIISEISNSTIKRVYLFDKIENSSTTIIEPMVGRLSGFKDFVLEAIVTNITLTAPLATLTSCFGAASSPVSFGVEGSGLTASVTITAPSNFEIATTIGGTYSSSLELYGSAGTLSSTLFARLTNSASVGVQTGTITASLGSATATSTISGTVNALPNIILTSNDVSGNVNDGIICAGASATLTASGGDTYIWDINASTASITISPESTTIYSVTTIDLNGCSNTGSVTITVNTLPVLSTSAVSICKEGSFLISASTTTPVEYGWNVTGSNAVNKNGYITAGTVGGDYEVSYTDGGFCTSSATVTVIAPSSNSVAAVTGGEASYKFDGATKGPAANIFMGYNGYDFASETNPINPGFYKANKVDGNNAGCPYPFYIFKCTNCPIPPAVAL
jgi:hypothetical protein